MMALKTARAATLALILGSSFSCGGSGGSSESGGGDVIAPEAQVALPEDIVPLYGEVTVFRAAGRSGRAGAPARFDLKPIIQNSKVDTVVVVPFDEENWYEPKRVPIRGTTLVLDSVEPGRDLLVALDLGDVARNNYQVLTQMMAAKGVIPGDLRPKICQQILCAADTFRATEIPRRIPEVGQRVPVNFGRVFADQPIGSIGRASSLCERCFEKPTNILPCFIWQCGEVLKWPIKKKIFTRKNIYSLTTAEVDTLRKGVAAMKAKPATDPTSWIYQAKMHALNSGVAAALQDQCQHRQFFFVAWHRMYTYYFERILRKASGSSTFALPYWNYTDVDAQRIIPEAYRLPANTTTNALYNSSRSAVYNGGAALPASDVSYSNAFSLTNFTTPTLGSPSFGGRTVTAPAHFPSSSGSGRLEQSPHNNVHNDVGGDMASGESPRDPVFWLHHANIDRLWKKWIALGGGRTNPTGDTTWMNTVFTFFDENGAQKTLTGAQVVSTVSQLGYRYDDDPLVFWPYFWPLVTEVSPMVAEQQVATSESIATINQGVKLTDRRQDVTIAVPPAGRSRMTAAPSPNDRVILQLQDIQYDQPVGVSYLLFLNLPADAKAPDHTHPNFIGTLGFFGKTEGPGHAGMTEGGLSEEYDVTAVVQRLGSTDDLRLTIVPSYPTAPPDRKDLQDLIAKLKPQGNPRWGKMVIIRQTIK